MVGRKAVAMGIRMRSGDRHHDIGGTGILTIDIKSIIVLAK